MTIQKSIGYGCQLLCDSTGGTNYVALGGIINKISAGGAKVEFGETTLLSDQYKTYLPADADPGEPSFEIAYDPADTASYVTLTGLVANGALAAFELKLGTVTAATFKAYVAGVGRELEKTKLNQCAITLRISGAPGF